MARPFVVDASVAAKWYLVDKEDRPSAVALLNDSASGTVDLVVPDLIHAEVPSVIIAATLGRRPRLTPAEARQAIADFLDVPIDSVATIELIADAVSLVHQHGGAFCDALYLALAVRLSIPFITADRRFYQRTAQLPEVVWLADYPSPFAR